MFPLDVEINIQSLLEVMKEVLPVKLSFELIVNSLRDLKIGTERTMTKRVHLHMQLNK